jgi:hypothetical protein
MTPAQNPAPFPKDTIKAAIADGNALVREEKTKVEATTAMYAKLKTADLETAVAAFMEGAGLTEMVSASGVVAGGYRHFLHFVSSTQ